MNRGGSLKQGWRTYSMSRESLDIPARPCTDGKIGDFPDSYGFALLCSAGTEGRGGRSKAAEDHRPANAERDYPGSDNNPLMWLTCPPRFGPGILSGLVFLPEKIFKRQDKRWQVARDRVPDTIEIDVTVSMDEPIPHGDDDCPGDFGRSLSRFFG